MLSKWENNNELRQRCEVIIESYAQHAAPKDEKKQKEIISRFNPRFILLHTLSHLLIKTLATHSGYGEPSIRERIYWDNKDRNGILLYTSGSSEGSLGGLVRLGETKDFEKRLKKLKEWLEKTKEKSDLGRPKAFYRRTDFAKEVYDKILSEN